MKRLPLLCALCVSVVHSAPALNASENTLFLAGQWQLSLAPATTEKTETYPDAIALPGTLDQAGKGESAAPNIIELNRRVTFNGTAWFQRDITLPENWRGARVELTLERTRLTRVFLDGQLVATNNSLSTPHRATLLENATPGTRRLAIAVNNDPKNYPMNFSHVWSDRIQTNWNGILGQITLTAHPPVSLAGAQLFPNLKTRSLEIQLTTRNTTPSPANATLALQINNLPPTTFPLDVPAGEHTQPLSIPLPDNLPPWDEFAPALHTLEIRLTTPAATLSSALRLPIPLRDFSTKARRFTLNGRPVFLRGKQDSGVFPLTGHAPMDEAAWLRHLRACKSAGLNYLRFHSWCPPEAAFAAADKLGIFLQPELPAWSRFESPGLPEYLRAEAFRILREYGNHPSFVMLTLGNELSGAPALRRQLVAELKTADPRRLYAQGSNNNLEAPEPNDNDDFWTTSATFREGGRVVLNIGLTRGSMLYSHLGHLNNQYPCATTHDHSRATARSPKIPVISHETGQYLMFPDFSDIPKYTGVLVPTPLIHQKQLLEKSGMAHLAGKFHHASGKLAELCYKEDIESVLRTPGMGGFALLDLQDYPGQGSGLVGMFNAFMEPKAFFSPEKFRRHNAPVTPLLLLEKRTLTTAETLDATLKIAHFGAAPLTTAPVVTLAGADGAIHWQRTLPRLDNLPPGHLHTHPQKIQIPLDKLPSPSALTLTVELPDSAAADLPQCEAACLPATAGADAPFRQFTNTYNLWLYPAETTYHIPKSVTLAERLDPTLLKRLRAGATVLCLPRLHELGRSIAGQFIANFWTTAFFKSYDGPGTLGLLLDPAHPVFKHFPTDFHSDWQWFPMTRHGRPMILDNLPRDLAPLVQVIDNFETSRKLGLLFEAKVGKGRLVLASINFLDHLGKPEVRQLLFSILRYMESPAFNPSVEVTEQQLLDLFRQPAAAPDREIPDAQRPGLNG